MSSLHGMSHPRNAKEFKSFFGLADYYREFVLRFANISWPLTAFTKKNVLHKWTWICQDLLDLLKKYLVQSPILKYPDPEKLYTLFTDTSKCAWEYVLMQAYDHIIEWKEETFLHPITYVSGLFWGSQPNWASLSKEAYAAYMSDKKLLFCLEYAYIALRSDHLPLKRFLEKKTL